MKKARFGKTDWLEFGLRRLADEGPAALKLNDLVQSAGKTIGSFYHHFNGQADFFQELMAYWRDQNTVPVITALDAIPDAEQRAERLTDLATRLDETVEIGVRLFASQNAIAARVVGEVDALRIEYVSRMNQRRFALPADQARLLAQLEYASFVGAQMVFRSDYRQIAPSLAELFQSMARGTFAAAPTAR